MTARAYYNEFDPGAAAWLRELIAEGHIAPGDVDTRSIADVQPDDLKGYTQAHFFAGIGGWSLALRLAGWPDDRPVWTGSCPCQPFSAAGKRKWCPQCLSNDAVPGDRAGVFRCCRCGHEWVADGRHLWPEFRRLIAKRRPPVVFGEQVASKDGRAWLASVRADLEALGHAVGAADLCSAGVGAPNIRQRLWWVADAPRCRHGEHERDAGTMGRAGTEREGEEPEARGLAQAAGDRGENGGAARGRTFWADADWLPCRDGKVRPVEPGTSPLVDGLSVNLDVMRSIEDEAFKELVRHGKQTKRDPGQVLRVLQEAVREAACWQEQSVGMRIQFHEAALLLDFLLCLEPVCNGAAERRRVEEARDEARRGFLRGLRKHAGAGRASCEWRAAEQCAEQFADPVLALSFVLARHAEAYRSAAITTYASSNRVTMLRGAGNAINPWVAAEFIGAFIDVEVMMQEAA